MPTHAAGAPAAPVLGLAATPVNATPLHVDNIGQVIDSIRVQSSTGVRTRISILCNGLTDFVNLGADTAQFIVVEITG